MGITAAGASPAALPFCCPTSPITNMCSRCPRQQRPNSHSCTSVQHVPTCDAPSRKKQMSQRSISRSSVVMLRSRSHKLANSVDSKKLRRSNAALLEGTMGQSQRRRAASGGKHVSIVCHGGGAGSVCLANCQLTVCWFSTPCGHFAGGEDSKGNAAGWLVALGFSVLPAYRTNWST